MPAALGQILLLFAVALHAAPGDSVAVPRWLCKCPKTRESVPWKSITDIQVIPKSSFCSKVEIVLTLGNAEVCLNPESEQGQKIQKCWDKIKNNREGKKKKCRRTKSYTPHIIPTLQHRLTIA